MVPSPGICGIRARAGGQNRIGDGFRAGYTVNPQQRGDAQDTWRSVVLITYLVIVVIT